ncbi:hypothetical protein GcC1_055029 [Golovinomyces cichoracearum]|uniref:Uncharacterized protein n=1 Tax=Golovinomyces cichoracearum TaxID=62708 RepID=A0A420IV93_9PEZI|nr:hypothetical protein GcC1_055029 [Golovinomyces cichoracearum]
MAQRAETYTTFIVVPFPKIIVISKAMRTTTASAENALTTHLPLLPTPEIFVNNVKWHTTLPKKS